MSYCVSGTAFLKLFMIYGPGLVIILYISVLHIIFWLQTEVSSLGGQDHFLNRSQRFYIFSARHWCQCPWSIRITPPWRHHQATTIDNRISLTMTSSMKFIHGGVCQRILTIFVIDWSSNKSTARICHLKGWVTTWRYIPENQLGISRVQYKTYTMFTVKSLAFYWSLGVFAASKAKKLPKGINKDRRIWTKYVQKIRLRKQHLLHSADYITARRLPCLGHIWAN